jgi:uncharacterized membrane protein YgcG
MCPRCHSNLLPASAGCGHCGCHLGELRGLLGAGIVPHERLIDHAMVLRVDERRRLEIHLDEVARRLPQILLSIFIGGLPHGLTPGEGAFWLLNQTDTAKGAFSLVIILDPGTGRLGISVGYALEGWLTTEVQSKALRAALSHLQHNEHGRAISSIVAVLDSQLRKVATPQRRKPEAQVSNDSHLGLRPTESEHQTA